MKAFMFNPIKKYDEDHGACVFANSEKEAEKIYLEKQRPRNLEYKIEEVDIKEGDMLSAHGHDHVKISLD